MAKSSSAEGSGEMKKLEEYKTQCKKDSESLVKKVFPRKVVELNDLLESEQFGMGRLPKLIVPLNIPVPDPILLNHDAEHTEEPHSKKRKLDHQANSVSGSKVLILPNGQVNTNQHIIEVADIVKPYITELIDHANKIKMWISYLIPRIEDGNNFGVGIQEDILAETRQVETEAATYLDQITRYFLTRGKIVSKIAKYPHVEDYRRTIVELDEKEFINIRLVVCELRNHYASLHDMITKNLDKIKTPRNTHTDNMY